MSELKISSAPTENTSICQCCGEKVGTDSKFCPYCGQTVIKTPVKGFCEKCGSELNDIGLCEKCNGKSVTNDASLSNIAAYNQTIKSKKDRKNKNKLMLKIILIALGSLLILSLFTYIYILPMIYYYQAGSALEEQNYEKAYALYYKLDDYKNSENKINDCIYRWADYILKNGNTDEANKFKNYVLLNTLHYPSIYASIQSKIDANSKFSYWDNSPQAETVYTMLQVLPTSYEDTGELLKLFKVVSNGNIKSEKYVRENKSFLETMWSIEFVRDFLTDDDMIDCFLEGNWSTYGDEYYLTFYKTDNGTRCKYNLPQVYKPAGTKFYDIKDLIYKYTDANNTELAKVYKFTVLDFNTISVFCYKNNRTYKLYR